MHSEAQEICSPVQEGCASVPQSSLEMAQIVTYTVRLDNQVNHGLARRKDNGLFGADMSAHSNNANSNGIAKLQTIRQTLQTIETDNQVVGLISYRISIQSD